MYTVKVLKRKDASSVVVAIILGMTFAQTLFMPISQISYKLSHLGEAAQQYGSYGAGWRDTYLSPVITMVVTLIVLEVFIRLFVWVRPLFVRKGK